MTSDCNDPEDDDYVVNLIERVTTVSIETMSLIAALPQDVEFMGPNTGPVVPEDTDDEEDLVEQ